MKELELTFPGGYKTKTKINGFEIVTDYPVELGGNNEYPKPWDVFLSTVTSCHGVHVVGWCIENHIPYKDIKITLEIIEDPNQVGKYTDFIIEDNLPESFPRERIQEMLDEATADCWINRHLTEYDVHVTYHVKHVSGDNVKIVKGK